MCLVKFIGYLEGVSGYKFYDPNTCTVILSCSPHFLEPTHSDPNPTPSHSGVTSPNVLLDDDEISIASDTEHAPDPDPDPDPPSHPVSCPVPPPPSPPLPLSLDEAPTRHLCDCSHIHAPEHWEHWEHWDSIGPSRSDQQCHFLVGSSQESHDLSGASSPFQEWLEVLDLPDCI